MRISDWSSDVCSSDLCQPVAAPVDLAQALLVVDVVAVLAAVAVARRPGDNGADVVTFLLQPPQLVLKARETFGRDQATDALDHAIRKDPKPRQPWSRSARCSVDSALP